MSTMKELMISQLNSQKLRAPKMKDQPAFYQNLEKRLDTRRKNRRLLTLNTPRDTIDFSSNDFLSISADGLLKKAFLEELAKNPDFILGSSGSRLIDGNSRYIESLKQDLADFQGAEKGLIYNSGYDANVAIFNAIPISGDVIVYDELVHASIHDGMAITRASTKVPFAHNDTKSFRKALSSVRDAHEKIKSGERTVLVSIESVYSMEGTIAPLNDFVRAAKEIFPLGNAQFIIDEAHSTGLVGERGNGLVCSAGLEKEFAVRLHTFGKALSCNGAVVFGNDSIKATLINFSRSLIYTTAPSFPALASARAAYSLLITGQTIGRQQKLQTLIRHFYKTIHAHPVWKPAKAAGVISIPSGDNYEYKTFLTHIVPVWTRARDNHHLAAHLHYACYRAWPIDYPVVPKGHGRVRLVFHAGNDMAQIEQLVNLIADWAGEMLEMKNHGTMPQCDWAKDVAVLMKKGLFKLKL